MASRLNPYIEFGGQAREALEFYRDVFGGELSLSTFAEFGGPGDGIMHGMLETPAGFTLMAADNPEGAAAAGNGRITISLSGDDGDELRGYWEQLAAGGEVAMPLERQMWGDDFGMCTDRFGVAWMVNIAGGGS